MEARGYRVIPLAFTHNCAYLVGGIDANTLTHFCHCNRRGISKKKRKDAPPNEKTVLMIDEYSHVPSQMWPVIADYHILGVKYITAGDGNQMQSPGEAWPKLAATQVAGSDATHAL